MQKRTHGRPKLAEGSTTPQRLDAMLRARHTMHKLIQRIDAMIYNTNDRRRTERGLDQLMLETLSVLRHVYELRNARDADVP
jgi:hypothetical protein